MPEVKPDSVAARALHSHDGTFMRKDATEILLPDDLSEGAGDLATLDAAGNPLSRDGNAYFQVFSVESPDGWAAYIGTATQGVNGPTKQVASPLPIERHSFVANQPLIQGDLPPGLSKIPRPLAPLLVALPAGTEGFAAGPVTSPYFVAHTWVKNGRHSLLGPPTLVGPVEFGQSIKDILPDQIPEGVDGIGLWLTEPGTSTPTLPGPFKLQRVVDVSRYNPGEYALTGPYRHEKGAPTQNETVLPSPTLAPELRFISASRAAKIGTYFGACEWTDASGESLPGPTSGGVSVAPSSIYTDESDPPKSIAGAGYLFLTRPSNYPPNATGWRPLVYFEGQWHALFDSFNGLGNEKPYPLSVNSVTFTGWSSATDSPWSQNERVFLIQRALPAENTTGIPAPTDPLEQPVVLGVTRYPAGKYVAGITEFVRDQESQLSPTTSLTINANQILAVIRQDRVNLIPNSDNLEVGADGLPLHQTIDATGLVTPYVQASDPALVLATTGPTSGTTGSKATMWMAVSKNTTIRYRVKLTATNPATGLFQGSAQAVLQEQNSAGTITETIIGTISAPGDLYENGTKLTASTTVSARILVRFSGSTKNLTIKIFTTRLYAIKHGSHMRRRKKKSSFTYPIPDRTYPGPGDPGDTEPPDEFPNPPQDPPGTDVGIVLPPFIPPTYEPIAGPSPALVAWHAPDRPSSSGTLLEAKHDFETVIPARWKQHVNGATVTLSRYATSPLVGTYSLRSYKAS